MSAIKIAIFNHKGGVGKTTLTVNVAFALAEKGYKVLIVDSDPQCNVTSYLIDDTLVNDLLDNSDGPTGNTIWSAIKPLIDFNTPKTVTPIEVPGNVFVLAGDVRLAEFEEELNLFWGECFQRKPRSLKATTGLSTLVNQISESGRFDFVFYDSGPNIGPLNRIILLDCDYFFVPAACDFFSIRAIKTLGNRLERWINEWRTIKDLAPDNAYLLNANPVFSGYIPQRFRVYAGAPSKSFAEMIPWLEKTINEDIIKVLGRLDGGLINPKVQPLSIGEVQDFPGLVNDSQLIGRPIWEASKGTPHQKEHAKDVFAGIAAKMLDRVGLS